MEDRVPTKPNRVLIRPEDESPSFYATMTRADEPTQVGDPLNKSTLLKDETAALFGLDETAIPDEVFSWIGKWGQSNWKLLAEYTVAGAYAFVVPDDVNELGVFILGGGGGGGAASKYNGETASAIGGDSGGLAQVVLKKTTGDFASGESIPCVVGAGAKGAKAATGTKVDPTVGGTSSFGGITSSGGQPADGYSQAYSLPAPYGLLHVLDTPFGYSGRNIFDLNDTHIYCGAGGNAVSFQASSNSVSSSFSSYQATVERTKGKAGAGTIDQGENATAPGDGGGAAAVSSYVPLATTGGKGADGLVLVYGRKVV